MMAHSVAPLLHPRSIAVIGATNRKESLGGKVTERLFAAGFTGRIFPVNPRQASIHSTKCYASILDIPDEVDVAIVLVPRDAAMAAVEECCRKQVKAVIVVTAGFGEVDAEGKALQRQLAELCGRHGVRLVGPNCMGIINTAPAIAMDATFSPTPALPGPIGFASQSGALGVAVLNFCQERGIGFSQFVSLGNKADVTENDFLEAWEDDPEVPVISMYLESFADAARFHELARRITPKKPIVLVKAGRTEAGAKAASSHTGALAAGDTGAEALCRQAGIIRARTVEEMLDIALVLSRCPTPQGNRVAVLTNAGGPAILCADAVAELGLQLPPLADETQRRLREILPREAAVANPVDMVASATSDQYARCLELLLADPGIDAVITINVTPPIAATTLGMFEPMLPVCRTATKPVLTVVMAGDEFYSRVRSIPNLPPIFHLPEAAARALAAVLEYGRYRGVPAEPVAPLAADDASIARLLEKQRLAGGGYLPADDTFRVLELAGVPVAPWRLVADASAARRAAAEIGYPVVLKAAGEAIVHKSDVGGVALNLGDDAAVGAAIDRMTTALVAAGHAPGTWTWLVQAFRPGGREVIIGSNRDAAFGPLVMFGLGGKYVEVFRDVQFGLTPLGRRDAERLVSSIKGLKLLTGTRGEAGVDLEPAIATLQRIAQLVERHASIAELDLNPLLLYPSGAVAIAVDARIRVL